MRRALPAAGLLLLAAVAAAEPVRVRHVEGVIHGFLTLRAPDGKVVATGDALQSARGDVVTSKLLIRFRDGSTSEETTVFRQRGRFRLVSDHLVQKGPFFKNPMDVSLDARTGDVTVKYAEKGEEKVVTERLDPLPDDLANGLVGVVMKSVPADTPKTTLSLLLATPKPRMVKLEITPDGTDRLSIGGRRRKVAVWRIKIVLGGLAGVLAPILGKDPPESRLWVLYGEAPTFIASDTPLAAGTPSLRMELVGPFWPTAFGTSGR